MKWIEKLRNKAVDAMERPLDDNSIDRVIIEKGQLPEVNKVYEARWVWYHTILAIEIAFTNILLLLILFVLAIK